LKSLFILFVKIWVTLKHSYSLNYFMSDSASKSLSPGTYLQNSQKFKIESVLGEPGGFGITYRAFFEGLNKEVAIKEYFPKDWCERSGNEVVAAPQYIQYFEDFKKKFLEEAKLLAAFENKRHIVNITDVFEENGTAYFVMEYIKGTTLFELVKKKGVLVESEAIKYVQQIGQALEIVHDNTPSLLHRDVKPHNIIIREDGEAVLIDFGAARQVVGTNVEHTGILTHGFAPPEQYETTGKKGPFVDIYALGATFYFCVTGQVPKAALHRISSEIPMPQSVNRGISSATNDEIIKAMAMEPDDRHRDMSEFTYALSKIQPIDGSHEHTLTSDQQNALSLFSNFLEDNDSQVLVMSGPEGSGKTHLIWHLISELRSVQRNAKILSIGSKISESIQTRSSLDISSIYSCIYDLATPESEIEVAEVESEVIDKPQFPISVNHDMDRTVYIVDEAHLLSDYHADFDLFKLGSGKLLSDFIEYLDLKSFPERKVVLIGDSMQLLRGNKDECAIWPGTLEIACSLKSIHFEFNELAPGYNKDVLSISILPIRKSLERGSFNHLRISPHASKLTILDSDKSDFDKHYRQCSPNDTIILAHSLKLCLKFNNYVRKQIFNRGNVIQPGDRVMLQNRVSVLIGESFIPINRNEIGTIICAENAIEVFEQPIKGKGKIKVVFRKVTIQFERLLHPVNIQMLDHLISSTEKEVTTLEYVALRNRALKNVIAQHGNDIESDKKAMLIARDEYQNAAHFKYAYSMTCHRAQGHKWANVFVECESEDLEKKNDMYFRWLYTAMVCSTSSIYLRHAPIISPWQDLIWNDNPTGYDESYSFVPAISLDDNAEKVGSIPQELEADFARHGFPSDKPFLKNFWLKCHRKLAPQNIQIERIEHRQFHEIYHFTGAKNEKARIIFFYNSKDEFGKRKLLPKGNLTEAIEKALLSEQEVSTKDFQYRFSIGVLDDFHEIFSANLSEQGINISRVREHDYSVEYMLQKDKSTVALRIFYNGQGFITRAMPQKYSSNTLHDEVKGCIAKMSMNHG